jgi:hypothetical protein
MKVEYVVLADAAQAVNGKLYILGGGWSVYRCATFPSPIQIAIAMSVTFTANEAGMRVPLSIVIADEAGVPIVPEMKGQIEAGQPLPDLPKGVTHRLPFAANMGILIPRAGRYTIMVRVGSSSTPVGFDAIFVGHRIELTAEGSSTPERGN